MKKCLLSITLSLLPLISNGKEEDPKKNVLFLVIDDLNDWISVLDEKNPIKMPNLEKLAAKGVLFKNAYCSSPSSNPSRVAVLTGIRPNNSGVYGNKSDWRAAMPDVLTIQQYFMQNGYESYGAGKVFHHHWDGAFHDKASFIDFLLMPKTYPDSPMPAKKLNGLENYGSKNTDWGVYPLDEKNAVDYNSAMYGVKFLSKKHAKPFFLSIGIFRPHMPFFCPKEYFDLYSDNCVMPMRFDGDTIDLPSGAKSLLRENSWFWSGMEEAIKANPESWINMVRAYQACATFADKQIGRILEALENSEYKENTIIVLWSDNGYHLGEKNHIEKFALWEKATHVPYIIVANDIIKPGTIINKPVDLMTIYPTLIDLCKLKKKDDIEGISLLPLINDPTIELPPALSTYMSGNHALRTERWRYIRYVDGSEELYDHFNDPNEWNNLANKKEYEEVIKSLRYFLPKHDAPPVKDMKMPDIINTEYINPASTIVK